MSSSLEYRIKRQRRKTLALHVLEDASIEVRAPVRLSRTLIKQFVNQRQSWLMQQQQRMRERLQQQPRFEQGQQHPFMGGLLSLNLMEGKRASVRLENDSVRLCLKDSDQPPRVEQLWLRWCREQAETLLAERLLYWWHKMPAKTPRPQMKLRRMRRRWGSCSSQQVITFNTRLIELPMTCIDYVVVHELCHLWHLNHSPSFYQLLESVMPDWRQREAVIHNY